MAHQLGRKFDLQQTLKEKSTWLAARNATDIALEFAILGYVDIATSIFTLFKDFSKGVRASWSPGLYFAWEATGSWPDCIPPQERTPEALKNLENERILWKRDTNGDEEGWVKLFKEAKGEGKINFWNDSPIKPVDLAAALDLALYLKKPDKAHQVLEVFGDEFHWTYKDLSKSRLGWRLLKDKAMAKVLDLDEQKVLDFGDEVIRTFKTRIVRGPVRAPYAHLSMEEIVQLCNVNTIKNAVWEEMEFDDPDNPPETILRDPAKAEEIKALEKRLPYGLPADYKEFLSLTNGLGSYWNGFYGEPALYTTEGVYLKDASEEQEQWQDAKVDLLHIPNLHTYTYWPGFKRVIRIGSGESDTRCVWLVDPELLDEMRLGFFRAYEEGDDEIKAQIEEVMQCAYGGMQAATEVEWLTVTWSMRSMELIAYASFREFLENLADETCREDVLDEEDEQGRPLYSHDVFAYGLRK